MIANALLAILIVAASGNVLAANDPSDLFNFVAAVRCVDHDTFVFALSSWWIIHLHVWFDMHPSTSNRARPHETVILKSSIDEGHNDGLSVTLSITTILQTKLCHHLIVIFAHAVTLTRSSIVLFGYLERAPFSEFTHQLSCANYMWFFWFIFRSLGCWRSFYWLLNCFIVSETQTSILVRQRSMLPMVCWTSFQRDANFSSQLERRRS